ncbi:MAG TPA: cold shock domain-containing protein [Geminicoccaceae bacterium]
MIERNGAQATGGYRTDVAATVKWYNPTKGFGFVKPTDGAPDAFLHASLVTQAGHQSLDQGAQLVCDIAMGPRGPQVAAIHSVEPPDPNSVEQMPMAPRRRFGGPGFGGGYPGAGGGSGPTIEGKVKFYNPEKGFGFVVPDDGSKDVFVSARTLTRAGIAQLQPEQRVRVATRMGDKGPMAHRVELL